MNQPDQSVMIIIPQHTYYTRPVTTIIATFVNIQEDIEQSWAKYFQFLGMPMLLNLEVWRATFILLMNMTHSPYIRELLQYGI